MTIKTNLVLDCASDFNTIFNLTDQNGDPINLSGYSAFSSMRRWYTSVNNIPFNTTINSIAGSITITMSANVSANLYPGRYVYDVEITNANTTLRVVEGTIFVTPAVTANTILSSKNE